MDVSRFTRSLPLFFMMLAVPLGMSAASYDKILPASGKQVTRGEFLRAAVTALDLPLKDEGAVPFRGVNASYWPYLRTAQEFGALDTFGKDFAPERAITRMEAARMLTALTRAKSDGTKAKTYNDVKNAVDTEAVGIAVERKWLKPLRATLFGAEKILTGREARVMLKAVALPAPKPSETVVPPRVVKLKAKQKEPVPGDEMLRTVWELLNENYLYPEKIDGEEAAYKAVEGLVDSLDDPYTTFLRPVNAKEFSSQLEGEVTGIGAQVEFKNQILIIISPLKGSPAEKAGLLPGDEILAVNGESLEGLDFQKSVMKVRGPKGTEAVLRIRRDGVEKDVTVVRDTVQVPEIEITWKGNIAVVNIMQFGGRTDRELRSLMEGVAAKNPTGLVLDLRNNPGGYLHAADIVGSVFLPKGSTIATILSRGAEHFEKTTEAQIIPDHVPIIVLVNKGSASASELVAGALQDAKRARILGETAFGKGTVQQVLEFTDGSSLKLTVAEWMTPKRRKIDGLGVTPDIVIVQSEEPGDEQLLKAIELLR